MYEVLFQTVIKPPYKWIASLLVVSWTVDGTSSEKTNRLAVHGKQVSCRSIVGKRYGLLLGLLMLQQNGFSGSSLIWGLEHGHGIYYIILSYSIFNTCIYIIFIHMYASFFHSRDGTFLRNLLTSWEIGCLKIAVVFVLRPCRSAFPADVTNQRMFTKKNGWNMARLV